MFPVETVEKILSFCDGKTLFSASNVDYNWKKSVEYLTKRTNIWKYCCLEEIPEQELEEYEGKMMYKKDKDKWLRIYENWVDWQNIKENIRFEILLCGVEVPRISCITVSGRFIAVGSEDGRVKIYNEKWDLLAVERYLGITVNEVKFIWDDDDNKEHLANMCLLVAYKCHTVYGADYHTINYNPFTIHDVLLFSTYKTYGCFVKRGGRISIIKFGLTEEGTTILNEITYIRIYAPSEVTSVTMWKGVCTFLINNDVKIVHYNDNVQPITTVKDKTVLKFYLKNDYNSQRNCYIFRDDLILTLCDDELNGQVLEVFILGNDHSNRKKMFNTWSVFNSNITCLYVYGNTFMVGLDCGNVYFYNILSWKEFDIRNYDYKMILGKHPIISIDVKETKIERLFYIATTVNIHKIIGYSVSKRFFERSGTFQMHFE